MPPRGAFDFNIAGDEQEQHRIQLEKNLQHTETSLHLSSTPDDSSVELPRHISDPSFSGMGSIEYRPRDSLDREDSHYQPWSVHTADDDDEGINPFGETLSTAAHHASVLTLAAGLGGRTARREASVSGAEYDPDRPVNAMAASIASNAKRYIDPDSTRLRNHPSARVESDPLVVDDSNELDRVLQPRPSNRPAISRSSHSSSSATPQSPRPKLTDALKNAAFSPKRPRSVQSSNRTPRSLRTADPRPGSPLIRSHPSTPGRNRTSQSISYADPVVQINPPTPEHHSDGSTFPRLAKGISREIEAARRGKSHHPSADAPPYVHSTVRQRNYVPEREHGQHLSGTPRPAIRLTPRSASIKGRLHLPDVTGLTSVVESPARVGLKYFGYDAAGEGEIDARILATLSVVQAKLAHLETENSISRRRVRDLEAELDECKKDVAKERTKLMDESIERRPSPKKERQGLRPVGRQDEVDSSRYQEVVEEKKALESLISTLQSHLSRLTAEISDHHRLLEELRSLQQRDSRVMKEKGREVDKLRHEVERLSGEVEVLRGVIEEGLRERRELREGAKTSGEQGAHESDEEVADRQEQRELAQSTASTTSSASRVSLRAASPLPTAATHARRSQQEATEQALDGNPPFIDQDEITHITEELEERRSERSLSVSQASSSRSQSRSASNDYSEHLRTHNQSQSSFRSDGDQDVAHTDQVAAEEAVQRNPSTHLLESDGLPLKSTGPATQHPRLPSKPRRPPISGDNPGVPRVRGTHLERLFYTAPPHDARTCTVCHGSRTHKQRRRDVDEAVPDWLRAAMQGEKKRRQERADDEGFDEDSDEFIREGVYEGVPGDALPPQTVLVKVLKELEDDFTHYKFIYIELADQYKAIDATSNVAKRNVLAEHLQDVIQVLERKGDQIASLHGLLTFKDKFADRDNNL